MKDIDTKVMPCLLRRSQLVNMVTQEIVWAAEHWAVMGFPHPSFTDDDAVRKYFPCASLFAVDAEGNPKLPDQNGRQRTANQKFLTGNAMHWAQISVWLTFALATSRIA